MSFGRMGAALAGLGLGYKAVQAIREITDARLQTYLNLGAGAPGRIAGMGATGIAPVSKMNLVSEFQAGNLNQFIL